MSEEKRKDLAMHLGVVIEKDIAIHKNKCLDSAVMMKIGNLLLKEEYKKLLEIVQKEYDKKG